MKSPYIERINQVYPDLKIDKVEENEIGQNNDVLIINDSIVFRFPKYQKGVDRLIEETKILRHLKGRLKLATPDPAYQSFKELEVGKVFTGYPLIAGFPLWNENLMETDHEFVREKLALQLVNFLIRLHAFSQEELKKVLPTQSVDIREEYIDLYKKIQSKLYSFMRDDAKKEISR